MSRSNAAQPPATANAAPTAPKARIAALDVLRGFALLGILLMNIQSFAMPDAAYFIPTVYGDLTGANLGVWWFSHLFADQKFMTLFSMLFGAGVVLMTSRMEAKGHRSLGLYYRRTFWLLVIGLLHAYLLWSGDILVLYAICGFIVYWFRNLTPRWLLIIGMLVFAISPALGLLTNWSLAGAPPEFRAELAAGFDPPAAAIAADLAAYGGSWPAQMSARVAASVEMQTVSLLFWGLWRAGGLMLMGMALYKWGVLTGARSRRFYTTLLVLGVVVGLPVVAYGAWQNFAHDWDVFYARFGPGYLFNYAASLLVSLAYVGVIMLWAASSWWPRLQHAFAAVGRTALTNYLMQTILATLIFYGHGLGLYGEVSRVGQLGIVVAIWSVELITSVLWLRYFRFGPAEWLWRSLTYWRVQPLRNNA